MQFKPGKVEEFLVIFNTHSKQIRNFKGVLGLELHRDAAMQNVFYTWSTWDSEENLEAYRHSELFKSVWARVRLLFESNPVAYSLVREVKVEGS